MRKSRLKLSVALGLVIFYMLSALVWWAFALVRHQESAYAQNLQMLNAKKSWANEYIYHFLYQNTNSVTHKDTFILGTDTFFYSRALIKRELYIKFPEFNVFFVTKGQRLVQQISLSIREDIQSDLYRTLLNKKKAWIYEGITLGVITILIGGAMFVYLDKIIRLNTQQNNFLLAVTHELKTPIAATKLSLQTLQKGKSADLIDKMISMGLSNIKRLSSMVDQILMATRFESKVLDPNFELTNLNEVIETTLKNMDLGDDKTSRINLKLKDQTQIFLDKSLIAIVIKNLVNNAFKYSESESSIEISTIESDSNIQFTIADNGIGIPDSEKRKVFEKFFRVGEEKTRKQPGSGLGLYLVKKIIDIHKGKVILSDNKPSGCMFTITLSKNIKLDEIV